MKIVESSQFPLLDSLSKRKTMTLSNVFEFFCCCRNLFGEESDLWHIFVQILVYFSHQKIFRVTINIFLWLFCVSQITFCRFVVFFRVSLLFIVRVEGGREKWKRKKIGRNENENKFSSLQSKAHFLDNFPINFIQCGNFHNFSLDFCLFSYIFRSKGIDGRNARIHGLHRNHADIFQHRRSRKSSQFENLGEIARKYPIVDIFFYSFSLLFHQALSVNKIALAAHLAVRKYTNTLSVVKMLFL